MNLPLTAPLKTETVDQDIADQARPGQGVPSQDPDSAAQFALKPEEAEREAKSAMVGGWCGFRCRYRCCDRWPRGHCGGRHAGHRCGRVGG